MWIQIGYWKQRSNCRIIIIIVFIFRLKVTVGYSWCENYSAEMSACTPALIVASQNGFPVLFERILLFLRTVESRSRQVWSNREAENTWYKIPILQKLSSQNQEKKSNKLGQILLKWVKLSANRTGNFHAPIFKTTTCILSQVTLKQVKCSNIKSAC